MEVYTGHFCVGVIYMYVYVLLLSFAFYQRPLEKQVIVLIL